MRSETTGIGYSRRAAVVYRRRYDVVEESGVCSLESRVCEASSYRFQKDGDGSPFAGRGVSNRRRGSKGKATKAGRLVPASCCKLILPTSSGTASPSTEAENEWEVAIRFGADVQTYVCN